LSTKTTTTNQNQNKIQQAGPAIQTGLDRYIHIKRKPQNTAVGNRSKINRVQIKNKLPGRSNSNRFALLAENEPEQALETQPKPKPPPIYIREKILNAQTAESWRKVKCTRFITCDTYCTEELTWKSHTKGMAQGNSQIVRSMDTPRHTVHFKKSV